MTNEQLRMQMLSGVITEGEYKAKLQENQEASLEDLKTMASSFSNFEDMGDSFSFQYDSNDSKTGEKIATITATLTPSSDPDKVTVKYFTKSVNPDEYEKMGAFTTRTEEQPIGGVKMWLSSLKRRSESKSELDELGGGMSPKRVFRRAIVTKLNKIYNSVDNEELKQKLMDTFNPTIDGILHNRYGDDINKYPMKDLLDDLDDYLRDITQPMIDSKGSLNESMIGGIVGVGAIAQIPPRSKADYEMAFEHFLGERYLQNFDNPNQNLEEADNMESLQNSLRKEIERILYGYVDDINNAQGIDADDLEEVAGDIVDYIMVGLNDIAGSLK